MGFIKCHKVLIDNFMKRFGVDWYSLAWVSWVKGLITGFIVYHFLLI